ncbi:uracil-DNA glycosylase [Paremcibacter congregatus]|uniref:uracil-DNA glycosylase n=1 Tax=Paremcibacter congregatus TaxID=2043170 RepID=UPI0030ED5B5E|tara:strand:+ start:4851 stop:5534 length:684 start_codon:yes stop_codon:yes gene_type:complete
MTPAPVKASFSPVDAPENCALCPRLVAFRHQNQEKYPTFFNKPVPSFGDPDPELLIVGLAPGLQGANKTGRPFTGDASGDLLFATLEKYRYMEGTFLSRADDNVKLHNTLITNAVRCVPPQNKTTAAEEANCRPFLINQISRPEKLKIILALGLVAHNAVLSTFGKTRAPYKFTHGALHDMGDCLSGTPITLIDSYHCSRYNTNTGRLTEQMFEQVFQTIGNLLATR